MFQVQHYRKIQTAVGLRNVVAHNMREKVYDKEGNEIANEQETEKWYNPDMAHLNQYTKDIEKAEQVLKKRADRIKDADLKRKPQKNASYAIEGVYSASPEFAKEWRESRKDQDTWTKFLDKTSSWVADQFGKENVLHASIHMDEKTPHLHVVMVPIMQKDGRNVYSSSNFLKGPKGLAKLQTEYHKKVGKKYGLDRGIEGSRATHQELKTFTQREEALSRNEDLVKEKTNELLENKHLLNSNIVEDFKPKTPKNPLKRSILYVYDTSDGKKKGLSFKKYQKYEEKLNKEKFLKKTQVENNNLKHETEKIRYQWSRDKSDLVRAEKELKQYKNMSPADLRSLADKMEKQQEQTRSIKQNKSIDYDIDFF